MNRKIFISSLTITLLFALVGVQAFSQISAGGIPPSFENQLIPERHDIHSFEKPDMEALEGEDWENAQLGYPRPDRMGISVMAGLDLDNSGTWTELSDGSRVWRLSIHVPDALALGVYYDKFYLPEGGSLFLYNQSGTQVIGAFTRENNHESGLFATEFVQGDLVTLEYIEEPGTTGDAVISISEVAYAYRHIEFIMNGTERGGSWPCMINVACEEGDGWEDQIRGVARMSIKIGYYYYWCSGSLINNTDHNRVPYFLSAEHCGEGASSADRLQWIFYFNYQATTCAGTWGILTNTITGCTLKAKDPLTSYDGADFELMQLNSSPPDSYDVYYNGWNRLNIPADSGVGVHHPAGDIKKISTYNYMISSNWWNGSYSHWKITWSPTANGLSIMQGGSSGSPIFDQDGYIMGDLSGGYTSNSCNDPSPAWYGKIWYAWDQNGSTPSTRLKDWLDPGNSGETKIPGLNAQVLPPVVDFYADTTHIQQGDTVHFFDLTTGNPALTWNWEFPGALPTSASIQNPFTVYLNAGTFDVTLTVTNADGTESEYKQSYITVDEVLLPEADFEADTTEITEGESINFSDLTINNPTNWEWIFEGGDPQTSSDTNPENIVYDVPGSYAVTLTAENFTGADTAIKENYITVNQGLAPLADFYADKTEIMLGDTVNFFDLSSNDPEIWLWTFEGGTPSGSGVQNPTGIVYNEEGAFDVSLRARNPFGSHTTLKEGYILVGNVSVKDINQARSMLVYPNPSSGKVTVRVGNKLAAGAVLTVLNTFGKTILSQGFNNDRIQLDLGNQPNGLYIIRIQAGSSIYQGKVSLIK
jgi:PKD repeat protein